MFGWENPVKLPEPSFMIDWMPNTRMYGFWILLVNFLLEDASFLDPDILLIWNIPVILTLLPGVQVSVMYLSTVISTERGISPVGIYSGASWSFMLWRSKYSLWLTSSLYDLNGQFYLSGPDVLAWSQISGASTFCFPNGNSCLLQCPQFWHFQTAVRSLISDLRVDVMIPGTQMNLVILLLWRARSRVGTSSEWTCTWNFGDSSWSGFEWSKISFRYTICTALSKILMWSAGLSLKS